MNTVAKRIVMLCATLMLASCALVETPSESTIYGPYLTPVERTANRQASVRPLDVSVEQPRASAPFDGTRIAVAPVPGEIQFYRGARWRDTPPALLQDLLLQAFDETSRVRAVGAESGARAEYLLRSELRAFTAEYRDARLPTANVQLAVQLVSRSDARIVAARTFGAQSLARGTQLPEVFAAFQVALNQVVRDVAEWTAAEASERPTETPSP